MGVVIANFLESTRTQTRVGSDSSAWGGTNLGLKRGHDSSAMHELDGVDALRTLSHNELSTEANGPVGDEIGRMGGCFSQTLRPPGDRRSGPFAEQTLAVGQIVVQYSGDVAA
jgi:hypothetical protein